MNNAIIRTLAALSLSALLVPALVKAQGPITVAIPFDFTVGSKSFAAGQYTVRSDVAPSVLAIQSADHKSAIMALTQDLRSNTPLAQPRLVFHRYGDQYFLSQCWTTGSSGRELPKSARERELVAAVKAARPVTLVASSSK